MIKFGTGGWRAIIADEFTKENIRLVTAGLCALMEAEGQVGATICLGYDRRFLSKEAMFWAVEVLAGYGFRPYVINRSVPTPLIMFTVKQMGLPYGLAITASPPLPPMTTGLPASPAASTCSAPSPTPSDMSWTLPAPAASTCAWFPKPLLTWTAPPVRAPWWPSPLPPRIPSGR